MTFVQNFAFCSQKIFCASCLQKKNAGAHASKKKARQDYNKRVMECIHHLNNELPSFALIDSGLKLEEQSCILMEKGRFYGMGYLPSGIRVDTIEDLKFRLTPYAENDYIRGLVYQYAARYPG